MPIPLLHSVLSWFLKKRVHQIELFLKYPNEVQSELLTKLIDQAKNTWFGHKYGFSSITAYEQFANQVPVSNYEDLAELIGRTRKGEQNLFWPSNIKWFAKSSGTTNAKSKFIPVSKEALNECHFKAGKDMLSLYFNNNPNSQLFQGKALRLGGSKSLYEDNNTYFGDLSAIIIENLPLWAEIVSTPSHKVSMMEEWETKMQAIIQACVNEDVTSLAGVPSWMLVLLQKIQKQTGQQSLLKLWPNAEVYFHGGVSFNPYREEYRSIFPCDNFQYYEIYNASEGFFGIQDQNDSDDLLLMLDYGIFYEFIPMDTYKTSNQTVIPLSEIEAGKNYAVVISTNAGLWRYKIGDTIRFTSTNPYRFKITGRTKHHINVFGEELVIENAETALAEVSKAHQTSVIDFTAGPVFMNGKEKGKHEWIVEFKSPPNDISQFISDLDKRLQELNSDYEAKRYKNMTLGPLEMHVGRKNLFHDWLKDRKKLGGQNKIPRLSNDREFVEVLLEMNR
jgi:phenylacetate-coenzyme A ligase PaaK-like adenylate-forming protein